LERAVPTTNTRTTYRVLIALGRGRFIITFVKAASLHAAQKQAESLLPKGFSKARIESVKPDDEGQSDE
jgi:hypothetical protein